MWKIALLVVSGLALKVQKEEQHVYPTWPFTPPTTIDAGMANIDAKHVTAVADAAQFITVNENNPNGQINGLLSVLADEGSKFMRELQDQNLMKDEIKYAPWEINSHEMATVGAIQSFQKGAYKAASNMGIPLVGVDIQEDDLDLNWYRKKGLILPPFPQVDVNLPILWTGSMKQSIARIAHELETLESDPLLVYKPCADSANAALIAACGAAPHALCGPCECFNDQTGDKMSSTPVAPAITVTGGSCAMLVKPIASSNIR